MIFPFLVIRPKSGQYIRNAVLVAELLEILHPTRQDAWPPRLAWPSVASVLGAVVVARLSRTFAPPISVITSNSTIIENVSASVARLSKPPAFNSNAIC